MEKCVEIEAKTVIHAAKTMLEFVHMQRVEKSEAYIEELISGHNKSIWRLFGGWMTRESFDERFLSTGQTFHLHLLGKCLMHEEEELAIEVGEAAALAVKLNGADSKIWLTSKQASNLYRYGGLS